MAPGTYWPYLVLRSPDGTVSRTYATAPLDVDVPVGTPIGSLDVVDSSPGTIRVAGWTLDPDLGVDQPIDVHVYVDGGFAGVTSAGIPRPDVADAIPGWGSLHGYDLTIGAGGGDHTVCTYAINVGPGGNPLLGCRRVTVRSGNPFGTLDVARPGSPGTIDLAGWTIDPDTAAATDVHVYVNGVFSGATSASGSRPDVAGAFPGYGDQHGFALRVPANSVDNVMCAYAINVGPGGNALIGCSRVAVAVDPFGVLDVARRNADGSITVAGWALDSDNASSIDVHVYVGTNGYVLRSDQQRPDVGAAFPGFGDSHGFAATIPPSVAPALVCAYGINVPGTPGGNSLVGCAIV